MKEATKKQIVILSAIFLFSAFVSWKIVVGYKVPEYKWQEKETIVSVPKQEKSYTPLQIQFLPFGNGFLADRNSAIRGFAMGYSLQQNEINGISLALMHAYNAKKNGLSMSLIELSGESKGLAVYFAGGSVNNRGVALGLWNMTETNRGVQVGLINQEEKDLLVKYAMKQEVPEKGFGMQAGVINYSESPGIQFGLWNTNPNSWLKHFPIINICF